MLDNLIELTMGQNLTPEQAIERLRQLDFNVTTTEHYIMLVMADGGCFNIPFIKINAINDTAPCIIFECDPYSICLYKLSKTFHITNYWN